MSEELDTRKLVLQILREEDTLRRNMLLGWYKPQLSDKQVEFINLKLNISTPGVQYAIDKLGWKLVN